MSKSRTIWQIDDYKTLPLSFITGRALEAIPAFGKGQVQPAYVDPEFAPFPFSYSQDCLVRASDGADYAKSAVYTASDHHWKLGYFLQFRDDPNGEKLKQYHSHVELASAIMESRLGINAESLRQSFEWILRFKFVQEAYREDKNRDANFERHVQELERVEGEYPERWKAGRDIMRAVDQISMRATGWRNLPLIHLNAKPSTSSGASLFYCYSHVDEVLRDQLEKHLSILQRNHHIDQWHDRRIGAGDEWRGEIDEHLKKADIILLLISPDFLASTYCYDVELAIAMERHDAGQTRVIPLFLRPCDWEGSPFAKLQGLPTDARPVTSWQNQDEAFTSIAKGIREAVARVRPTRPGQ